MTITTHLAFLPTLDLPVLQQEILAYVRTTPFLTKEDLLCLRGLMLTLGLQEPMLPLWTALTACLTDDARERDRLLETLAHPWHNITHEIYSTLQDKLRAAETAPITN